MTLDPFLPEKPEDVERLKALQLDVHETFIDIVKERRAGKLKDDPDAFHRPVLDSPAWTGSRPGRRAGRRRAVLKEERFGPRTKLQLITPPRGFSAAGWELFGAGFRAFRYGNSGRRGGWFDPYDRGASAMEQVRALKKSRRKF